MEPKVGIVLVNYNGEKFQNDCLCTIKEMNYKNYEIIVVDNGSSDNSIEMVKRCYTDVHLIETGLNNGVAKGNNIGIEYGFKIGCEYILLLNNDTEVHQDMLTSMIKKADNNTLVTCKMYYFEPKNMIWCAGGEINWYKATTTHYGEHEIDEGQFDESKYVEYTPTCCLLIHKEVFERVGYMDEQYFMYYDDTDFCVRVNRHGFKIWYEAKAKLWHKVSSSSGGKESKISIYYGNRNRLYFIHKYSQRKIIPLTFFYLSRSVKYIIYTVVRSETKRVMIKAIKDYYNKKMFFQKI